MNATEREIARLEKDLKLLDGCSPKIARPARIEIERRIEALRVTPIPREPRRTKRQVAEDKQYAKNLAEGGTFQGATIADCRRGLAEHHPDKGGAGSEAFRKWQRTLATLRL